MRTGSLSRGVQRPKHDVDHPTSSSAEVKEKVQLKPLLPLWALVASSRVTFTFTFYTISSPAYSNDIAYKNMKFPLIKCQTANTFFNPLAPEFYI